MTTNVKLSLSFIAAFLAVVLAIVIVGRLSGHDDAPSGSAPVVRDSSHRLSTAAIGEVTLVEFLDFECESCRAAYPVVEQLRQEYGQQVTFVMRYFPIPSHFNSRHAALAVEAAAQQGRLQPMYRMLFETQSEWGEQRTSKANLFRSYAEDLGLDMAVYDAAIADPATDARIQVDVDDGTALGVTGTPTFFLNGKIIEPRSDTDLRTMLDAAVNE